MKPKISRFFLVFAMLLILAAAIAVHLWRDFQMGGVLRLEELLIFSAVFLLLLLALLVYIGVNALGLIQRLRRLATSINMPDQPAEKPHLRWLGEVLDQVLERIAAQKAELERLNAELERRNHELLKLHQRSLQNGQALTHSQEMLDMATQGADLGIWVWIHLDGEQPLFNRRWPRSMQGTQPEIGPGQEGWLAIVHPDDLEQASQNFVDHVEGRTEAFSAEYRIRDTAGEWIWILDQGRVLQRNAQGKPVCIAGTIQDISVRREVEENLRSSVARFHAIFAQAGIGISLIGTNGRLIEANRALHDMLGYDPKELTGLYFLEITHPDDREVNQRLWEEMVSGARQSYQFEKRYLRKKGGEVWCSVTVTPVHTEDGRLEYGIAMIENISLRKKAEAALSDLLTAERHQRELAQTLREIGAQMSATLDYQAVLMRLLQQIPRLIPCDVIDLLQIQGEVARITHRLWLANTPRVDPPGAELRIADTANLCWMSENQRPLVIANVRSDPDWVEIESETFINSWAGAPIISADGVVAFLSLSSSQPNFFNQEQAETLTAFTGQAALAIQNARLFQAAQRRAEEAETLRQATSVIVSALDLERVLDAILEQLDRVVPYDSASVFLQEGEWARLVAGSGLPEPEKLIGQAFNIQEDALLLEIIQCSHPVILTDAKRDPRFHGWGGVDYVGGWMGVPLRARGQIIGVLTLDSRQSGAYSSEDAALAQAFADEASIAVENARLFHQVQRMATTDPLTDLYNRRHFYDAASDELERSRRYAHPVSLVMIDFDHFKDINDTYGHPAGDQVLIEAARRCRAALRDIDVVARYGGEEFVILLPETGLEGALQAAERLRQGVMEVPVTVADCAIPVSISLGVASLQEDCANLEALLENADQALYLAKDSGRGRVYAWRDGKGELAL